MLIRIKWVCWYDSHQTPVTDEIYFDKTYFHYGCQKMRWSTFERIYQAIEQRKDVKIAGYQIKHVNGEVHIKKDTWNTRVFTYKQIERIKKWSSDRT